MKRRFPASTMNTSPGGREYAARSMFFSVAGVFFFLSLTVLRADPVFLPLSEAVQRGLRSNAGLRVQENETKKAELDMRVSDSFSYPDVSLFSGFTYLEPRPGMKKELIPGLPPLELNIGRNANFSHGLQIRYILYEGGRRSHIKEASLQLGEASRWLFLDRRRTVEFEVRQAYLGVLLATEVEKLAADNLSRSSLRAKDATAAFNAGAIPKIELLRAQAEEADARVAVDEAKDRHRMALSQLSILINFSEGQIEPEGSLATAADSLQSFDPKILHQKNPEFAKLMAASFQRRAALEAAEARKGELYPTVATGLKVAETNPYRGEARYGPDVSAFIQLTYPIFDSGRSEAAYEKAKLDAENAVLQADELERSIRAYYGLLIDRIESYHRSLEARRIGIERATLSRDAAQVAWKNGSIDLSRLLDAEVLLTRSLVDYYRTTSEFYGAIAEFERLSGISTGVFGSFH